MPPPPSIQAEAFGPPSTTLLGNPCAVVFLSSPSDLTYTQRQQFTSWTNLSEATFLLPPTDPSKADYKVHIHDNTRELPFAGHPTLCSARAWLKQREEEGRGGGEKLKLASGDERVVTQECGVGLVKVRIDEGGRLSLAAPSFIKYERATQQETAQICEALSIDPKDVLAAQWTDNGPGWCTLLLKSARAVLEAKPIRKVPYEVGLVGPYAPAIPKLQEAGLLGTDALCEDEADTAELNLDPAHFEVRALFQAGNGTVEDPTTGSLNAGIAKWFLEMGWVDVNEGRKGWVNAQGMKMGRRGRVYIEVEEGKEGEGEEKEQVVWVGGEAGVVIEGRVMI